MEKIKFTPEGETPIEFYVLEQTTIGGVDYYLVTDTEEGDGEAMIMKDLSQKEDADAIFEFVEEDAELEAVAKVFESILEDIKLE
ncbi:MAG: DUF1292 domain-containing protein [Lachnospiraceae bacterium]